MIKTKDVTITKQQVTSITCDVCKKEYVPTDYFEYQEIVTVSFVGGYGSIFGDGNKVRIDICQHCFKEKLGQYITYENLNDE